MIPSAPDWFSAVLAGVIAAGTGLMALLVEARSFGEIPGPAYAVVAIGAIITIAKDLQSSKRVPKKLQPEGE